MKKAAALKLYDIFILACKKIKSWLKIFGRTMVWQVSARVLIVLFVIIAFAQAFFAVRIYGMKSEDKATKIAGNIMPFPIAVVNHSFINYSEYQKEKDYIHHFYNATQQDSVDFKVIDSQILDQLIENEIIAFEALRYGATVSKKEVDASIETIISQNGGESQVVKVLDDLYGLSLNDFRKLVKVQMLRDKVNDKVIARITASHILIRVEATATQEQVDAGKAKIVDILDQINNGLDFAEAATKFSEDTGSAANGGQLDPFAKGEMVDQFSETAFSTPVGTISEPVRTDYGWHIINITAKTGIVEKKFPEWLDGIKDNSLLLKFF